LHGGDWAFSAVAEPADGSSDHCAGAVIGRVGADGQLQQLYPLAGTPKVEGLSAVWQDEGWQLSLAVAPENQALPAQLWQVSLPKNE
jgi:hypothetical protein